MEIKKKQKKNSGSLKQRSREDKTTTEQIVKITEQETRSEGEKMYNKMLLVKAVRRKRYFKVRWSQPAAQGWIQKEWL